MDDRSDEPFGDDLSFLADLDHGLDLDAPPASAPERRPAPARTIARPTAFSERSKPQIDTPDSQPDRHETPKLRRRRPLLELFPPSSAEAAPEPPPPVVVPRHRNPAPTGQRIVPLAQPRLRPVAPGASPGYEIFYGLNEKPFSLTFNPRFLYHSTAHDRAAHEILAAIERREGTVIVTGGPGSGKTTLCRSVIDELDPRTFTSLVLEAFLTIEDLLKQVLIDFGVISRADLTGGRLSDASKYELTIALKEFLLSLVPLDGFAVIFVDDAHSLPAEMLEQVRSLSDLERDKRLIQLVLVGEPSLLTRLGRPDLHQLEQRVAMRCNLGPLTEDEIDGYVLHRLAFAGNGPSRVEFDEEAFKRIFDFSRGVPRDVNRICDRALTLGHEQSASVIDAEMIETAAGDLDLSPAEPSFAPEWRVGVAAAALVGLMLIGAAGAAIIFRDRVYRAVSAWQAIPAPPQPPPHVVRPVDVPAPDASAPDTGPRTPARSPRQ